MNRKPHPSFNGLLHSFQEYPDRTALTDKKGTSYTYSQLYEHIGWCKEKLEKKGVSKGTRVLVAVPMSMELYALMEALFAIGAVIVFLDPWLKGKQMAGIIRKVKPELFITTHKIRFYAYLMPATWSIKKWWSFRSIGRSSNEWQVADVSDDDVALITFTGGTGGRPKGADRTFGFLDAQLSALESHMRSSSGQPYIDYTNFPIVGLADFAMGNHVVIPKVNLMKIHEADPGLTYQTLKETEVNRIIASPSLVRKIKTGLDQNPSTGKIEHIITGGAPVPYSLIRELIQDCPEIDLEVIYGSTEAEPIALTKMATMQSNMDDPLKGTFVGLPVREIRLRIISPVVRPVDHSGLQPLPNGEAGEVVVTGDHVNKSYFENTDAFKENKIVEDDGKIWHRTGDIGYIKDEGLYLVGRLHRIVSVDGSVFHPYPVESMMERKLGINDCGYLQHPSGEVVLHVGTKNPSTVDEIKQVVREAGYPLDDVKVHGKSLPRDPRHRSKLNVKPLLNG